MAKKLKWIHQHVSSLFIYCLTDCARRVWNNLAVGLHHRAVTGATLLPTSRWASNETWFSAEEPKTGFPFNELKFTTLCPTRSIALDFPADLRTFAWGPLCCARVMTINCMMKVPTKCLFFLFLSSTWTRKQFKADKFVNKKSEKNWFNRWSLIVCWFSHRVPFFGVDWESFNVNSRH